MFYSRTIKSWHHSSYITWPKVQMTTRLVYISLEMKLQIGELGGNILVHTNCMDITMAWKTSCKDVASGDACGYSFALHIIFCLGLGEGNCPLPLKWRPCVLDCMSTLCTLVPIFTAVWHYTIGLASRLLIGYCDHTQVKLIDHGLTSIPTQYRLFWRQFYRSKDPTNSIKVLKEKTPQK